QAVHGERARDRGDPEGRGPRLTAADRPACVHTPSGESCASTEGCHAHATGRRVGRDPCPLLVDGVGTPVRFGVQGGGPELRKPGMFRPPWPQAPAMQACEVQEADRPVLLPRSERLWRHVGKAPERGGTARAAGWLVSRRATPGFAAG